MKIIDCPWELINLNCRVAEIGISNAEVLDIDVVSDLEKRYDYVVLKISSGNMLHTQKAMELGYTFAETQLTIQKNKSSWHIENDSKIQYLLKQVHTEIIDNQEDFDELMRLITRNMFSTDRIYLDPLFGPEYSERRYKNWIKNEYEKGNVILRKTIFRGKYVGFSLCKMIDDSTMTCILAGCFENYQKSGIGFWIPLLPELYGIDYKFYTTHISSNNLSVWQMYNQQQYDLVNVDYVFVKHIHKSNEKI